MYKINPQHLLRMKLFVNLMDDMAKDLRIEVADLPISIRKAAWEQAVNLVNQQASNFSAGILKRS